MTVRRRAALLIAAALLALAVTGCGSSAIIGGHGEDEGTYLTIGNLKYQVQVSRQLNPYDIEDRAYLSGLPASEKLRPDEEWFAVFMRVQNRTDRPLPAATTFQLRDTAGNVYTPVPLQPSNPFAYFGETVPAKSQLPLPDSPAANFPGLNGALLLFRLRNFSFIENRPLVLTVYPPGGGPGVPGKGQESLTLDI